MNRETVISELKKHPILNEGNRNNDAVNLAIVAYADNEGKLLTSSKLYEAIDELINKENIPTNTLMDLDYLEEKCKVLMGYLPYWYNTGDIYSYAII